VGPFALAKDLGERKTASSASDFRTTLVEPLSDARTPLADFFSILLERATDDDGQGTPGSAIPLSFAQPWIACALNIVAAIMWMAPDRRIEQAMAAQRHTNSMVSRRGRGNHLKEIGSCD